VTAGGGPGTDDLHITLEEGTLRIEAGKIPATLDKGVLEIKLPKAEEAKPKLTRGTLLSYSFIWPGGHPSRTCCIEISADQSTPPSLPAAWGILTETDTRKAE
jgi:hypothetical protein